MGRITKDGNWDMRFKEGTGAGIFGSNRASSELRMKIGGWLVAVLCAIVMFIPMLIVGSIFYGHLATTYLTPTARRINDIYLLWPAVKKCFWWNAVWFVVIIVALSNNIDKWALYAMMAGLVWFNIVMVRWATITYFGCIVDPKTDRIYFRQDQSNYGIVDYITFKWFRDLDKIDSVAISEIGRVSRQHWETLYIAGDFGSRTIWFSNKQKRDECLYAIQNSGRAKMMHEFES